MTGQDKEQTPILPNAGDSGVAQAYLAAIVYSSTDAIVSKNLDGIVTSWNPAAERIFGYTAAEIVGQHISKVIPKERIDEETQIIKSLRSGKRIEHFETVRVRKDGALINLSLTISPIHDSSGVMIGASKVARDITEQKKYEALLKQTNEQLESMVRERTRELEHQQAFLKAILDNITNGIVACNENGELSLFNRATKELHGLPDEPLPADKWAQHYNLYMSDGITPMDTKDVPLYRAFHGERVRNSEMVIATANGTKKTLLASGQALYDDSGKKIGAVVSMNDITAQKLQEIELIESRGFLRMMIDTIADPIFVKDSEHRWIEGNKAFWNLIGPEHTIKGKTDYDLFPKDIADQFWEGDDRVFSGNSSHDAEERLRNKDGKDILIVTRKQPFTRSNGERCLVGIIRDITVQRAMEEELRLHRDNLQELVEIQTRDLQAAKDAAEAGSQSKSEFLANMSHEIRTPLNAIVGLINIIADKSIDEGKKKDLMGTLKLSSQQLVALINDLLDMSKIQDQSFSLEEIPFDLKLVGAEAINIHSPEAQRKGVALKYICDLPKSLHFTGDPVRLRQIIINLVSNAVKFTAQGRVDVEITCDQGRSPEERRVIIKVKDTGVGIPKDKLDMIFARFTQADSSVTRKYGGTGLGLSICKSLAEMMGGHVSVKSEEGKGALFTVEIPMKVADAVTDIVGDENIPQRPDLEERQKHHILLVEDYAPNVLVAGMILEGFGYSFDTASNGQEALDKMRCGGFDLVLMDVQMPEMDGFTATRQWRQLEAGGSRIPIIGMTAHALKGDQEKCIAAGMDDYIAKPFDTADLKSKIAALVTKA